MLSAVRHIPGTSEPAGYLYKKRARQKPDAAETASYIIRNAHAAKAANTAFGLREGAFGVYTENQGVGTCEF